VKPGFIVLEGIDGSGTTTQVRRLVERLAALGHDAIATREPSDGPVGKLIREVLEHRVVVPDAQGTRAPDWSTLALLFAADRADHTDRVIRPALERGQIVVSDRYTLSSLVYQSLTGGERQEPLAWLRTINQAALVPALVVVLEVGAEVAAKRRALRGGQPDLFELDALQARLALAYARAEDYLGPGQRVEHLDGNRPVDEVFADVERAALRAIDGTVRRA
jgi:dTMP kinase